MATAELFGGSTPGVWFREHFTAAPFREEMTNLREVLNQTPAGAVGYVKEQPELVAEWRGVARTLYRLMTK